MAQAESTRPYPRASYVSWSDPNTMGGLAIRTTPPISVVAAIILNIPQLSFRIKIERTMTITGEEKRIVVESPRGSLEKLVKMNSSLRPPVKATKKRQPAILSSVVPRNESFLYFAIMPIMTNCMTPLITTTCIESISLSILIMLEYAVMSTPDMKAKIRPNDLVNSSFSGIFTSDHLEDLKEEATDTNERALDAFDNLDAALEGIESESWLSSALRKFGSRGLSTSLSLFISSSNSSKSMQIVGTL